MAKKNAKKEAIGYAKKVYAILIVIVFAIGAFVYSVLTRGDEMTDIDVPFVNPHDEAYPSGPPMITPPTTPPPDSSLNN